MMSISPLVGQSGEEEVVQRAGQVPHVSGCVESASASGKDGVIYEIRGRWEV